MCASESTLREVAGRIARLVEASLLVVERRAQGRAVYRLLIPIREYLQASSPADAERVTPFFVDHYLNKAWVWCPDPLQTGADLNQMDDDIDNIREALDSAFSTGRGEEAGLAVRALHGYFYDRYLHPEGIRWTERALEQVAGEELRAWLLRVLGSAAQNTNDIDRAARLLADALRRFRRLGNSDGMAMALLSIAQVHANRGEWSACERAARRARRLLGSRGNRSGLAVSAYYVGESRAYADHVPRALPSLARAARLFEETGQPQRAAYALSTLVMAAVLGGLEDPARRHLPRALDLARRSGSGYRLTRALTAASAVEAVWGDPEVGRRLLVEAKLNLGPLSRDVMTEFALPAGYLLRRLERWDGLIAMLAQTESAAASGELALGVPWQRQIRRWRAEAMAHGSVEPALPGSESPIDGEQLARRTLEAIAADATT